MDLVGLVTEPARRASLEVQSLIALIRAGMVGVERPDRTLAIVSALRKFGLFGALTRISALRHGDRAAIVDEDGELTFAELEQQVNRLANAWRSRDLGAGSSVGILCRNGRAPLIVAFAASRLGMNAIWLNTAFSARQARDVAEREGVDLLVADAEFADAVAEVSPAHGVVMTATDEDEDDEIAAMIAAGDAEEPPAPSKSGRVVLLTSGTTGTPKGAPRRAPWRSRARC